MVSLLHRKKHDTEKEIAGLLAEQTGDPAYALRVKWIEEYGKGNYNAALKVVNEALEVSHQAPVYLALRAMTHLQLKWYADAAADVAAALAADPAQKEALDVEKAVVAFAAEFRDKARELGKAGNDVAALYEMTKAVDVEPGNAINWFMRGVFHAHAEHRDQALADLRKTLELDPAHEQAREMLEVVERAAEREPATGEAWHCYVCSGNPSLIDAFRGLFAEAGMPDVKRAFVSSVEIEARRPQAREAGLAFAGAKHMGTSSDEIADVDAVLGSMGMQGTDGVHVCAVTVDAAAKGAVLQVYEGMLEQAMRQGIMPFPMFATANEEAARFLDELLG